LTAFSYLLDVCRVNAGTALALNKNIDPSKQNSYDFGMKLVFALIRPHINRRPLTGLQISVKKKMSITLGYEVETRQDPQSRATQEEELHPKNLPSCQDVNNATTKFQDQDNAKKCKAYRKVKISAKSVHNLRVQTIPILVLL